MLWRKDNKTIADINHHITHDTLYIYCPQLIARNINIAGEFFHIFVPIISGTEQMTHEDIEKCLDILTDIDQGNHGNLSDEEIHTTAVDALEKYAPAADEMGLPALQSRIEELGLKYAHPDEYTELKRLMQEAEASCAMVFETFALPIRAMLDAAEIEYTLTYRMKSIYSIWRKIRNKGVCFDEVYDLFAARIVYKPTSLASLNKEHEDENKLISIDAQIDALDDEECTCWRIYTILSSLYRFHPERTRNWISHPRPSGYQALQVTAMGPDCNWVEIQIRSERMDYLAEHGTASHWLYKQRTATQKA